MRAQAEAIAGFATVLRELRRSVGNPPFREMSGRSGAISHTTLYEATKGNRLPSWATTVEFVKACGADPAAYRERWERANRTVRLTAAGRPAAFMARSPGELAASAERDAMHMVVPRSAGELPALVPAPALPSDEIAAVAQPALPAPMSRRFRSATVVLAAGIAGVATVVLVMADRGSGPVGNVPKPPVSASKVALTAADCPVHVSNPAPAPPTHEGDAAMFIADVTLPDCARVGAGKVITKVWRLKNAGTVPWEGYSLRRLDLPQQADQCQTISDVPIDDTPPGKVVDIRTHITTPRKPGLCYVRFKMVDASGRVAFPGNRPVNFQVIVKGP
ncbi:NBR1-Ig-like domain-containing protein [Spirillospora sp. NPDC048911]|uniref:NBR1-Ig-like domain-containing protein n=1 Tax=Spirillospora sp. NPDC048911 TaxID=3364527 RepID=UPI00372121D3